VPFEGKKWHLQNRVESLSGSGYEKCPANGGPKGKILERQRKTFEDSYSGGGPHEGKFS